MEGPEGNDSVEFVANGGGHLVEFRDTALFCHGAPPVKGDPCVIGTFRVCVDASQGFFEQPGVSQRLELFTDVPKNVPGVFAKVFLILKKDESQSFELFLLSLIELSDDSPTDFVQFFIHQLDHVKVVENDVSLREILADPARISICHVHGYNPQFAFLQFFQSSRQSIDSLVVSDMNHRSGFQVSDNRQEP